MIVKATINRYKCGAVAEHVLPSLTQIEPNMNHIRYDALTMRTYLSTNSVEMNVLPLRRGLPREDNDGDVPINIELVLGASRPSELRELGAFGEFAEVMRGVSKDDGMPLCA